MNITESIQIKGLGKCFRIPPSGWVGLAKKFKFLFNPSCKEMIWAVKGVDLSIKRGECIGIIGKNGSGKTTLLKLINGVLKPTEGEIKIKGTTSLIHDLGSSFDFELTGKENLFLYGAITGLSDKEINKKLKDVIEFSELGEFINLKIKTYSSGMILRLAFAAATITNPDILLIDEALSVGDLAFQNKSLRKIKEYKQNGKTIVIVSQNIQPLVPLCERYLLMHKGQNVYCGSHYETFKRYIKILYNDCEKDKGIGIIIEFLRAATELMDHIDDKTKKMKLVYDMKKMLLKSAGIINDATDINTLLPLINTFNLIEGMGQIGSSEMYEAYENTARIFLNASPSKEHSKDLLLIVWKKFWTYPLKKRVKNVKNLRETFIHCVSFTKNKKDFADIASYYKSIVKEELNTIKYAQGANQEILRKFYKKELLNLK